FDTFLRDTEVLACEDGTFLVGASGTFAVEWLENRLRPLVRRTLSGVTGEAVDVRFVVRPPTTQSPVKIGPAEDPVPVAERMPEPTPAPASTGVLLPSGLRLNNRFTFKSFVVGAGNRLAHAAAVACAEHPGEKYNPL